jgi:hypothetical protein
MNLLAGTSVAWFYTVGQIALLGRYLLPRQGLLLGCLMIGVVAAPIAGAEQGDVRVVEQIPAAAEKRDRVLINKFLDAVLHGRETEARDLLDPFYSGTSSEAVGRQVNYSADKLLKLNIFRNDKATIDAIYYFQDTVTERKHLRYYFVIYRPGINHLHEVMKIELINSDNIFYLHNIWAPR